MRTAPRFAVLFALCTLAVAGCDLFGSDEGEKDTPLPEGAVLAASMDGNEPALWLFDPQTLERQAVIETEGRAPAGVAFSPNYERWYVSWITGSQLDGSARNILAAINPASGRVTKRTSTSDLSAGGGWLFYEPINDHIVSYGNGSASVQFFDPETLELVHRQPIGEQDNSFVAAAAVAEGREKVYFGADTEGDSQIYVYDAAEQAVTSAFALTDDPVLRRSALSDVALSPDERYLYATTYLSPGGPGRFYMVDLESRETVYEGPAGGRSSMAVHPDGRYVYIDCPAGGRRLLRPTEQVLRFDTQARDMEVFIEGAEALGLGGRALIADQITMLPNGEAFVIKNPGLPVKDSKSEVPSLLKVDAQTGSVLATYVLPRNNRGHVVASPWDLHFGIVAE